MRALGELSTAEAGGGAATAEPNSTAAASMPAATLPRTCCRPCGNHAAPGSGCRPSSMPGDLAVAAQGKGTLRALSAPRGGANARWTGRAGRSSHATPAVDLIVASITHALSQRNQLSVGGCAPRWAAAPGGQSYHVTMSETVYRLNAVHLLVSPLRPCRFTGRRPSKALGALSVLLQKVKEHTDKELQQGSDLA